MFINCNLVAPVRHEICDLLGIPRNVYGAVSSSFDVLERLISDMRIYKKKISGYYTTKDLPEGKLYKYLLENDLIHYVEEMLEKDDKHSSIVEMSFINFVLVKYFVTDAPASGWVPDSEVVDDFRVPVELLTSDIGKIRRSIGKTKYHQIELIPRGIIKKWKVRKDKAIEYGLHILPEQMFVEKSWCLIPV